MYKIFFGFATYLVLNSLIRRCNCVVYTYEDIELRRIFPSEFPQDTIRKSGSLDPELGRKNSKEDFNNAVSKQTSYFTNDLRNGDSQIKHLGRYAELESYYKYPKAKLNSHFEELVCYDKNDKKMCKIDVDRYSPDENAYYISKAFDSPTDRRRVYCFMLLCFTEDELDRVVASF